jgi:transcriptional regulator with XRE-family HTH domain
VRNARSSAPHDSTKEALRKALGASIRRERTARAISQEQLAARSGLNSRTIAKIEAGEIGIRSQTLDRIQRTIGCSLNNGKADQVKRERKGHSQ